MKISRTISLIMLALAAGVNAQSWSDAYEKGLKLLGVRQWADARTAFQQAITARPEDFSDATVLPGSVADPRKWRGGLPYSPNFGAAYAGYKMAMALTSDAERTQLLKVVSTEFATLVSKNQSSKETYYFLGTIYGVTREVDKQRELDSTFATTVSKLKWRIDPQIVSPEELALIDFLAASSTSSKLVSAERLSAPALAKKDQSEEATKPFVGQTSSNGVDIKLSEPTKPAQTKADDAKTASSKPGLEGPAFLASQPSKVNPSEQPIAKSPTRSEPKKKPESVAKPSENLTKPMETKAVAEKTQSKPKLKKESKPTKSRIVTDTTGPGSQPTDAHSKSTLKVSGEKDASAMTVAKPSVRQDPPINPASDAPKKADPDPTAKKPVQAPPNPTSDGPTRPRKPKVDKAAEPDPNAPIGKVEAIKTKYALLIGNSESRMEGAAPSYAATDAQYLREKLTQRAGYDEANVDLVINATAEQIMASAKALAERIPAEATVYIYFSGVGTNIEGFDYLAGVDTALSTDTSTMVAKNEMYKLFMAKGAKIFSFYQCNRPIVSGRYFGMEVPMVGAISQMQATIPGANVTGVVVSGIPQGVFSRAMGNVFDEFRSNKIPILEFAWQVFDKIRGGDGSNQPGGSTQVPTLPVITNMANDARF